MPTRTARVFGFGALLAVLAMVYFQGRIDERVMG